LWGAFDLTFAQGTTPNYATTQFVTGGTSAVAGSGIGVRRATLVIDRTASQAGADNAVMHFDFLNFTSGSPDDTWITADYTTLEGFLSTWMTAVATSMPSGWKFTQIIWHRVGTGITKPNPAERNVTLGTPITGSGGTNHIPQAACSITFRTGVRRSWGRTYLPWGMPVGAGLMLTSAQCDSIASSTNTLVTSSATNDFQLVVVSAPLRSALTVESIEVDNVYDVIRRRRWKKSTYKKILP